MEKEGDLGHWNGISKGIEVRDKHSHFRAVRNLVCREIGEIKSL